MTTKQTASTASRPAPAAVPSWDDAPYPVLMADRSGSVLSLNRAAGALFADAAPGAALGSVTPSWLAAAHVRASRDTGDTGATAPATGEVGDRSYEAHATRTPDGSLVWWLVDDTDRTLAEQALSAERERTALLAEASNLLLSSLNVERCMEVTAQLAARHLADAAVVVAPARGRSYPVSTCGGSDPVVHHELDIDPAEVPGLGEALQGFPPVPSRWINPGALPGWAVPEGFTGDVGSVVVTPLPGQGVPAGALILLRRNEHLRFSESEEVFAGLFAARAGAAVAAARMYAEQTAITTTLLRELLPPRLHHVAGVEFAGAYRASQHGEQVGGDFYDVHPGVDEDTETFAVLGDVCGKGLEAAVLTGKIRTTLAALLPMARDHGRVLELLNGALLGAHTRFATLVLASVRRRRGQVHLRLTSAGHLPPLLLRADGTVVEAETRGSLVGVLPEVSCSTAETVLAPGETCLLYTDGIPEARGGPLGDEMFGEGRLRRVLAECVGMPAEAVTERVQMLATQWAASSRDPHVDDMAVLAITAPRSTHLSAVDGHTRGRYTA
jgi:serine phosphatase RsbU (regulator of sigma subunit)